MKQRSLIDRTYWRADHAGLLLLLTLLCFWPLTFGLFSAKNDNIVQFLPVRYQVSEALRHGHLPLWSPYMYLGYPVHGDMQGGAWNPLVWLLSAFGTYNLTALHVELLAYIFLGGLGMYRLLGVNGLPYRLRLAGAAAFLMCGYITDVGGSNAPFLAAVACIPFALAYACQLIVTGQRRYAVKTALAMALLFVSAYPSFFITTAYLLAAGWLAFALRRLVQHRGMDWKKELGNAGVLTLFFLGLSAPAILSYAQVLPFYQRGSGVGLAGALQNSFHPVCSLSFLLPSVPVRANVAGTDLISRNTYFTSFFLVFALAYAWMKKRFYLNLAAAGLVFFFLFSLGSATPVREWCYRLLPLMDTFRHPSNARLFVILPGIVLGAEVCGAWLSGRLASKYMLAITGVMMIAILMGMIAWSRPSAFFQKVAVLTAGAGRTALKTFFDALRFGDLFWINGLLQLLFLGLFIGIVRYRKAGLLTPLLIANAFVFAQLSLPYTFVSQVPPRAVNQLLRSYPKGYPLPDTGTSIALASAHALDHFDTLGITAFYQKQIATTTLAFTPTFMTPMEQLQNDSSLFALVRSNPYAYLAASVSERPDRPPHTVVSTGRALLHRPLATGTLQPVEVWNNGFRFHTSSTGTTVLCLQQLYLPGWEGRIDGIETPLEGANGALMAVAVPRGAHEVVFRYRPGGTWLWFLLALSFFSILMVFTRKNRSIETH